MTNPHTFDVAVFFDSFDNPVVRVELMVREYNCLESVDTVGTNPHAGTFYAFRCGPRDILPRLSISQYKKMIVPADDCVCVVEIRTTESLGVFPVIRHIGNRTKVFVLPHE